MINIIVALISGILTNFILFKMGYNTNEFEFLTVFILLSIYINVLEINQKTRGK